MTSNVIRGTINRNRTRLEKLLADLPHFGGKAANIEELETRRSQLRLAIETIKKKIETMESKHQEWLHLIDRLKNEEKQAELQVYEQFMTQPGNFSEKIEEAQEAMTIMDVQLEEIQNLLNNKPNGSTPITLQTTPTFDLPKLEPLKFKGDPLKFQAFWDQFHNLIDHQHIPNAIKFTHLLNLLEGDAKSALEAIPITDDNYEEAVNILKNRFGNIQIVRRTLYGRIQNLPKCSNALDSIKQFADTLEKTCRQLRNINEDPDQTALMFTVQEKLPYNVLEEVIKNKPAEDVWTMEALQKSLKKYISVKEEVNNILGETRRTERQTPNNYSNPNLIGNRPPVNERFTSGNDSAMKRCELCGDRHFADECI
ncbi:unnamed protein product, partial [Anisakis simplex]|uniref:Retrotransposon gag domain-containing protein n=1 Tax=Anisakis simplex TaxID=6269 RepID=A0A0M3J5J7_ANISI